MSQTLEMGRKKAKPALSQLEQLKRMTRVVADTGDYATLKEYEPEDATTNPSLILKAAQKEEYHSLVEQAIADNREAGGQARVTQMLEELLVLFGVEILKIVPGRVSTETHASLSFDTAELIENARRFIALYEQRKVPRERVLVKLASTWEGIRAAETLQREGINCNMTLLFSLPQAVACAEAKAKLISPFVGRILDWHKANDKRGYAPEEDPGVLSVREIFTYYKKFGYPTEIMGASFRSKGEVLELAGCDLLTISPDLLAELKRSTDRIARKLSPEEARNAEVERLEMDEKRFRWLLNENAMATEKLAEGIRRFNADALKLQRYLSSLL